MTVDIHIGDCRTLLAAMEPQSVHCCVTSPPYFGLRDYNVEGQLGLEPTPDEFVAAMVTVFREVRRVLRNDGTLWLNLGDSYATDSKWGGSTGGKSAKALHGIGGGGRNRTSVGLPDKNLIGIPWRVAFALQADGWILRQDIVWNKPNCMPDPTKDRCTRAHEFLFMLTKSKRYYYDAEAIREPAVSDHKSGNGFKRDARVSYQNADGTARGNEKQWDGIGGLRNKRSVWTVSTKPFKGAHFATFPPDLIEPCILAGCPAGGTVLDPFGGAGTTGLVAKQHGRNAILCELNPEYAAMARERIDAPPVVKRRKPANDNPPPAADLFSAQQ